METSLQTFAEKTKNAITKHIVDSTAIVAETTPIYAALETLLVGMPPEVSFNTRAMAGVCVYTGMGYLFSKGRDISRKLFHITDSARERVQQFHDSLYNAAFSLTVSPVFYFFAGSRNVKEIAIATACSVGLSMLNGGPLGYGIDLFEDLTGVNNSARVPEFVKSQKPIVKKGLAALLTAAAAGLTAGVYHLAKN